MDKPKLNTHLIRDRLEAKQMTEKQLADQVMVNYNVIRQIMCGAKVPSIALIARIGGALECDYKEFL